MTVCIDDICKIHPVVTRLMVPIPLCNPNGTLSLPGNGTLTDFVDQFVDDASTIGIHYILEILGIEVDTNVLFKKIWVKQHILLQV